MAKHTYILAAGMPEIQPVSGPYAGVTFKHGVVYTGIPAGHEMRFLKIGDMPGDKSSRKKEVKNA